MWCSCKNCLQSASFMHFTMILKRVSTFERFRFKNMHFHSAINPQSQKIEPWTQPTVDEMNLKSSKSIKFTVKSETNKNLGAINLFCQLCNILECNLLITKWSFSITDFAGNWRKKDIEVIAIVHMRPWFLGQFLDCIFFFLKRKRNFASLERSTILR